LKTDPAKREKSEVLREIMVQSFLVGLEKGATFANIMSGFLKSGLCPVDRSVPLSSQFATTPPDPEIYQTINTGCEVGNRELTSPENLAFLCKHDGKMIPSNGIHEVSIPPILSRIFSNTVEKGLAISPLPPYFNEISKNHFVKVTW
jgi:hypothetical protein